LESSRTLPRGEGGAGAGLRPGGVRAGPPRGKTQNGSFSAVSTPIFAGKHYFSGYFFWFGDFFDFFFGFLLNFAENQKFFEIARFQ